MVTKPLSLSSFSVLDLLTIPVCWNFAVAQPLFDVLSRGVEFFLFRRVTAMELVSLVLFVSLMFPFLIVAAIQVLRKIAPAIGNLFFLITLSFLLALMVLPLYRDSTVAPALLISGIIACGSGVSAGYFRYKNLRTFFLFLIPAILLIPALFLANTQVRKIIQQKEPLLPRFEIPSKTPIVFIVFDEFPVVSLLNKEGFIDEKSFPNFARLVNQADWYRNATTVASKTSVALPGILTGNTPDPSLLPTLRDYPRNLFTLLSQSYDIQAIEAIAQLCPRQGVSNVPAENFIDRLKSLSSDIGIVYLNIVLPADWRVALPSVSGDWGNFAQQAAAAKQSGFDKTRDEVFDLFLDSIRSGKKPVFYFLHSFLPHSPWQYLPSGKEYSAAALDGMFVRFEKWTREDSASLCAQQRHILQVAFTDQLIGRLISRMTDAGIFDQALIVITADHGVSFRPGDARRFITATNYPDIVCVPMIIKKPGQKSGRILDWNVETSDIVPTIAEILDFRLPWKVTGVSVLHHPAQGRERRKIFNVHKNTIMEVDSVAEAMAQSVALRINRIGEGLPFSLPATDLSKRWLGTKSAGIKPDSSGRTVQINNFEGFKNVDPSSNYLPVFVSGSIHFPDGKLERLSLAIGVNGRILAVTRTFPLTRSSDAFGALIPEESLLPGKNEIQILSISESTEESFIIPLQPQ